MKSTFLIAAILILTGCAGGLVRDVINGVSPGEERPVVAALKAIEESSGARDLPLPRTVPVQAHRAAAAVRTAMQPLEEYVDPKLVRRVACADFTYYTQTGQIVPDSRQLA